MRLIAVALLVGFTLSAQVTVAPTDDRAEVALQAAIRTEILDGDLNSAIRQYEAITRSGNRKAAAQALVKMGHCYEKLGRSEAAAAYERVIREYGDQVESVIQARAGLGALKNTMESSETSAAANGPDKIGWYNGDWCHCAQGIRNQIISKSEYALVYDDFIVPAGGWTVVGVFSHNVLTDADSTEAYWEIRSEMSDGHGGKVVASKTSTAKVQRLGQVFSDGSAEYEVRVDGLKVRLEPGRYWLAVAPVVQGLSYIHPTTGSHAVGTPRGDNGESYLDFPPRFKRFMRTDEAMARFHDSSLGVRIASGTDL